MARSIFVLRRFLRVMPVSGKPARCAYLICCFMDLSREIFQRLLYDQKMEMPRAIELQPHVNTTFSDILRDNYTSICFVFGKTYLKAFENTQELVPTHTESIVAHGRIGEKQALLKDWLWENSNTMREETHGYY